MTKYLIATVLFGAIGVAAADDAPAQKRHHKPTQEQIDACAKSQKADPCSFKLDDKEIKGTCKARKHGDGLVCRRPHGDKSEKKT